MFSKVRIAKTTAWQTYGLGMKSALAGISSGLTFPVVMMMWTGGHLSRTAAASFIPSIEPGMSMSVKTR